MKKIFTLSIASLMTLTMFAADRRPSVTLTSNKKFEVVIDGKSYANAFNTTMNVSGMYNGQHSIQVYALKNRSWFGKKKLVSSSTFQLGRNDVAISVDRSGHISIQQERSFDRGWDDHGRNDHGGNDRDSHYGGGKRF